MIIFKKVVALHQFITSLKQQNKTIGFVPTMGALHQGHLSLIDACKKACDVTVCSIFVNPTQFNDPKDFEKYPITLEQDMLLLTQHEMDILFLPSVNEIYPAGVHTLPHYNLGALENILEGKYRPGHFQGVCQVVDRLLNIVQPDKLFLGRKDYQQCMVINKLIELKQLPIALSIQPTLREEDGLAMSSRNMRLTAAGRKKAVVLYRTLLFIKENAFKKGIPVLIEEAKAKLLASGFEKIDYITVADANTLQEIKALGASANAVVLAAAFLDGVRLIDNLSLSA
ncbi:pantoate--beta-alanine ligase [Ilyomonas limi]|uniref:Pantothenate synthetase n=1 Tax=Ilyomonas limi TaxID=2575867 RepID=A0A4U3L1K3_9BACT|nr:pantoate--beta-alanine ligase [Ilyomonas limi]TKK68878.1 pantoate--beta-alanine ligase [Ilyomonas limi]